MKIVRKSVYARAGLLGNPSDGYFGKTISVVIPNFSASVVVYEWPELEIVLSQQDRCHFERLEDLVEDVRLNGLYGGLRLIKAGIKLFAEYFLERGVVLPERNFSLRYQTSIPRQVGLAGSSGIVAAVILALLEFYEVTIPKELLPSLILQVETREIGIAAGLQDRVCQVYGGLVYMDFDRSLIETRGYGRYENLDMALLPDLYLAYRQDLSQISGIYHSNLRQRWEEGDTQVIEAMKRFAQFAEEGRECLLKRDRKRFSELMDSNFDLRASLVRLDPQNVEMVRLARSHGVSAKYAGSGGSIVGVCPSHEVFCRLQEAFRRIGCEVIRPQLTLASRQ